MLIMVNFEEVSENGTNGEINLYFYKLSFKSKIYQNKIKLVKEILINIMIFIIQTH